MATKQQVFMFDSNSGIISATDVETATKVGLEQNTKTTLDQYLKDGGVFFGDDTTVFYSSVKQNLINYKDALAKEDQAEEVEAKQEVSDGTKVYDADKERVGEVFTDGNKKRIRYIHPTSGKQKEVNYNGKVWTEISEEEYLDRMPTITPEVVEEEVALAVLTSEELTRKAELEKTAFEAQDAIQENFTKFSQAIATIRDEKLFADEYFSFQEYAEKKFNLHGNALHRVARIGELVNVTPMLTDGTVKFNEFIGTNLAQLFGKVQDYLELNDLQFHEIRPVIDATMESLVKTAPKDENGRIVATGKFIKAFLEPLKRVLEDSVVTIDGVDTSIEDAIAVGTLHLAVKDEVLKSVAESIRQSEIKINQAEETTAPTTNGTGSTATKKQYYGGKQPTLELQCDTHKAGNTITSIGKGALVLNCGCRGRMSDEGEFYIYAVGDKLIKLTD